MHLRRHIPETITQFVRIYITALSLFSLFRLTLFLTETARINSSVPRMDILRAFLMGLRFDTVISGYILVLPFIVLTVFSVTTRKIAVVNQFVFYYIVSLFSVAFLVCAIDIPYFNQFFARLSISVFEWIDSPAFVFKMIVQEPRYWLSIIPLILVTYLFIKQLRTINPGHRSRPTGNKWLHFTGSLLFLALMLLGIRGRLEEKSPIRIGTANFSNNAFLNQLGLNPNFTLIRSYLNSLKPENKRIHLIDDATALANVQKYLHIAPVNPEAPLLRKIEPDSVPALKYNVVVVIMESMSAAKMTRHGNPNHLTPFLDSISQKGYYFENTYTAGIHTFNGIFSTLFSYPALFRQHPMKENAMQQFEGVFSALKTHDYSSIYFTTHDGQFDNVEGFLKGNDCEAVITKSDYPADKVKTTLGVPDDYMFEYSIPLLNKLHDKGKPFFAAFMTASDHGPYYIPDYFKPKNIDVKSQIVEYADYALGKFIDLSSRQKWFQNTIFVFVADHGAPMDGLYDMSLDYNHSPLLFYAPERIKEAKTFDCMAGQIDIFPTIMGLLQLPYENNTLGIDLLQESRPYIFFNGDDKYGVIDNDWFLVVRNDRSKGLYKYRDRDTHNYAIERVDVADQMDLYARSNLQAFQQVIHH